MRRIAQLIEKHSEHLGQIEVRDNGKLISEMAAQTKYMQWDKKPGPYRIAVVNGFVGWSVGENLMAGSVRVKGNASECAGASSHGGTIVIEGDASSRAGISLKGGTILVAGDVGHMSGFMAQAGLMLIGGDAGHALGDSLYEAVIYVAGKIASITTMVIFETS